MAGARRAQSPKPRPNPRKTAWREPQDRAGEDSLHLLADPAALENELRRIRGLFFYLFVEAVVRTVKGEDKIWLIESGVASRAYRWSARREATTG